MDDIYSERSFTVGFMPIDTSKGILNQNYFFVADNCHIVSKFIKIIFEVLFYERENSIGVNLQGLAAPRE